MPILKNTKHEQFARYIAEGMSAKDALPKLGYLPNSNALTTEVYANNMARRPAIRDRIQELRDQAASKTNITIQRVLEELAKIGFANMMDYMKTQPDGTAYVDLSGLDRDKAAAISEIVVDEYTEGKGDDARQVKRVRFKLHDKRAALLDIGKHLGMFRERVEVTGKDGGPIQTQGTVQVELLDREERDILKRLLLAAAERKRERVIEHTMAIEHDQ